MELNKLLKTLLVVAPIMALSACSSTDATTDGSGSTTSIGSSTDGGVNGSYVGTGLGTESGQMTPEEQQRMKQEELRRENIIYFDFDRSEVSPLATDILLAHGNYLLENPSVRILIEGHSDERGTPEYNIALGERRAKAVAKYLQSMGVQPAQMSIVSYGEEKPQDFSRSDEGFSRNRRAVLVY